MVNLTIYQVLSLRLKGVLYNHTERGMTEQQKKMTFQTSKEVSGICAIKDIRLSKGISIAHVSRATGLSRERIYKIESGKSEVPGTLIQDFAEAYGVDLVTFIRCHREDVESAKATRDC